MLASRVDMDLTREARLELHERLFQELIAECGDEPCSHQGGNYYSRVPHCWEEAGREQPEEIVEQIVIDVEAIADRPKQSKRFEAEHVA